MLKGFKTLTFNLLLTCMSVSCHKEIRGQVFPAVKALSCNLYTALRVLWVEEVHGCKAKRDGATYLPQLFNLADLVWHGRWVHLHVYALCRM